MRKSGNVIYVNFRSEEGLRAQAPIEVESPSNSYDWVMEELGYTVDPKRQPVTWLDFVVVALIGIVLIGLVGLTFWWIHSNAGSISQCPIDVTSGLAIATNYYEGSI